MNSLRLFHSDAFFRNIGKREGFRGLCRNFAGKVVRWHASLWWWLLVLLAPRENRTRHSILFSEGASELEGLIYDPEIPFS